MGSVKLDQSWLVSFRPLLPKAALANNHHDVMAQLLEEWGAHYCKALEKLEAHSLEEQGEEQPSALAAVMWMHVSLQAAVRQEIPGDKLPSSHERGMN